MPLPATPPVLPPTPPGAAAARQTNSASAFPPVADVCSPTPAHGNARRGRAPARWIHSPPPAPASGARAPPRTACSRPGAARSPGAAPRLHKQTLRVVLPGCACSSAGHQWFQMLPHLLYRAEDTVLRGIRVDPKHVRDLLDRPVLQMPHHERCPLRLVQLLHRYRHPFFHLSAECQLLRVSGVRLQLHFALPWLRLFRYLHRRSRRAFANVIDGAVHAYPVQPRAEIRPLLETRQAAIRPQERFLHHFVGVILVTGDAERHREY